jgi:uncharacterized sulfatase
MCTAIDYSVGRLMAALRTLGLAQNTLVVYTTEHGHFFEQRWNQHQKRLCYDEAALIPLLMKLPGVIPAGQVSDMLVNSVDLSPTILGLLGLPAWGGLDGLDLSAQIMQKSEAWPEYTALINVPYIDKTTRPHQPVLDKGEERCLVHQEWKLILSTTRAPELYDLAADQREQQNLWAGKKNSPEVQILLRYLGQWADKTDDKLTPTLLRHLKS